MEEKIPASNEKLKAYFEKLYEKELTEAEVLEYKQKLVSFFSILIEIDQKNKRKGGIEHESKI